MRPLSLLVVVAALGLAMVGPARAEPSAAPSASAAASAAASVAPNVIPPRLLSDVRVVPPENMTEDVTVVLTIVVTATGAVRSVEADKVHEPYSSAAVASARRFVFAPAMRGDTPVAAKIKVEINFRQPELPEPPPVPASPPEPSTAPAEAPPPSEVTVRGARIEPGRTATLTRAEVRQIPGTFGDPFRAIEMMPGVTPIVSGLPFFFIRGAPPGNVGYFLDGLKVPLLFHVGAGPSVVHPALIDRVDLYPGGYPARFGRFAGGVVSGETTAPLDRLHGEYNLRLFDAGAMVETPFASGKGTVLLAGRYSYTAALLSLFSPQTALSYWDYQGRVTYDVTPKDTVSVFALGSYDFLGQKTPTGTLTVFGTEFHRVDLRYDRDLGRDNHLRTAFTWGFDRSRLQQDDRSVHSSLYGARTELSYHLGPDVLFRAGTQLELDSYAVDLGPGDLSPSQARIAGYFASRTDTVLGLYADTIIPITNSFELTSGARVDLYGSAGATAVGIDPRVALRTRITSRLHFLSALGIAHQAPGFVVPVPGFQPSGLQGGLQEALQESLGLEFDLGNETTFTATAFQNAFFHMTDPLGASVPQASGCLPGAFPSDVLQGDRGSQATGATSCNPRFASGVLGPDRSGGGGQGADSAGGVRAATAFEVRTMGAAYGLELYLKKRLTSKLGGFLTYTLSRSTRSFGNRTYIASFDRTHVVNAALAYDLGKHWRAGTRVVFYTGLPKAPDPTDPSSTRLPPFFRLDLRLEKRWQLRGRAFISLVAEWMNATLSKEAVSTRCTLSGCEAQTIGPITIPSLGVEGGF
jgi:hypothetical protein